MLRRTLLLAALVFVGGPVSSASALSVSWTAAPTSPRSGQAVTFSAQATGAVGPVAYTWAFGDGGSSGPSADPSAVHAFTGSGSFSVTLTADDGTGPVQDTHGLSVSFNAQPTTSPIVVTPSVPCPGQPAVASVGVDDEEPGTVGLSWDGGAFGSAAEYAVPASFAPSRSVTVRARDAEGNLSVLESTAITVPAPSAFPVGPPYSPLRRESVQLSANAAHQLGCALTVAWDFDRDGTVDATGPTVMHAFGAAGTTQSVGVIVSDGATAVSRTVSVTTQANRPPTVQSASASAADALPGEELTLSSSGFADVDGDVTAVGWDTDGDGKVDLPGATATFRAGPGTRAPTLLVTDDLGAVTRRQLRLRVYGEPVLAATGPKRYLGLPTVPFVFLADGAPQAGRRSARATPRPKSVKSSRTLGVSFDVQGVRKVTAELTIPARLARLVGIKAGGSAPVLVARGTSDVDPAGAGYVRIAATDAAAAFVRRLRRAPMTATLVATDGHGKEIRTTTEVVLVR